MPLSILYQDQWLAAVDKPAGMLVHPGRDPEPPDQIAMKVLRDQLGRKVYTVHRLDRPTSGILLFALDSHIETELRTQFENQSVTKNYTAVVHGQTKDVWNSEEPLQKTEEEPFREAETCFDLKSCQQIKAEFFSVLSVTPRTGRYHQIRKHLASNGTPIVGDYLYGEPETMDRLAALIQQPRLMLHAGALKFYHPVEGIDVEIRCDLPPRFSPFL